MLKRMDDNEKEDVEGSFTPNISCDGRCRRRRVAARRLSASNDGAKAQVADETLAPNAFVRIKPDDTITLVMPQVEMGQGTYTSMSMLIAEELEVDLRQDGPRGSATERQAVRQSLARVPGHRRLDLGDGILGASATGRRDRARHDDPSGGGTVDVDPASCRAEKGEVVSADGRAAELWRSRRRGGEAAGAGQSRAQGPQGFHPDWNAGQASRHAGEGEREGQVRHRRDDPRHEVRDRRRMSRFWRQAQSVDDSKTMAIKGVRQVVKIENAVAVVGDHMWAAMQGLAALDFEWDDGPNASVTTASIVEQMARASQNEGVSRRSDGDFAKAIPGVAKKIDAVYEMPFLAHAAMEPMNCTVHVTQGQL